MTNTFAIEGELTVFSAHALKTQLLHAMASQARLEVNLSEVTEFDGAGLQLLLAASQEAAYRAGLMVLTSPPDHVKAALRLTGLLHHFEISEPDTQEATP